MINIQKFIADAKALEGVPFHHQGRNLLGVDCVGLILHALAQQNIIVASACNYSVSVQGQALLDQIEASGLVHKLLPDAPRMPGDLLVFRIRRAAQHVAIALPDNRMIHVDVSHGVRSVTISPLWDLRLVANYRLDSWT